MYSALVGECSSCRESLAETVAAALVARPGSVRDGHVVDGGALNPGPSDLRVDRNLNARRRECGVTGVDGVRLVRCRWVRRVGIVRGIGRRRIVVARTVTAAPARAENEERGGEE